MGFVENVSAFVSDCINERGKCFIGLDTLGYNKTVACFSKAMKTDLFIRDDVLSPRTNTFLNRQLLYDGLHIRCLSIPLKTRNFTMGTCVVDGKALGASMLSLHWRYIASMYRDAPYFQEFKPVFEGLYAVDRFKFKAFCSKFANTCSSLLSMRVSYTSLSKMLILGERTSRLGLGTLDVIDAESDEERCKNVILERLCNTIGEQLMPHVVLVTFVRDDRCLYEKTIYGTDVLQNLELGLLKYVSQARYRFRHPTYCQSQSVGGIFVPHLGVLDFIFNCGAGGYDILQDSVRVVT